MPALVAASGTPVLVIVVVVFCLVSSAACLVMAVYLARSDEVRAARQLVKDQQASAKELGTKSLTAREVDLAGMAKLAEALQHLDPAGRFLLFAFGFAASASFAAGLSAVH
jgi:hypothetical protein